MSSVNYNQDIWMEKHFSTRHRAKPSAVQILTYRQKNEMRYILQRFDPIHLIKELVGSSQILFPQTSRQVTRSTNELRGVSSLTCNFQWMLCMHQVSYAKSFDSISLK